MRSLITILGISTALALSACGEDSTVSTPSTPAAAATTASTDTAAATPTDACKDVKASPESTKKATKPPASLGKGKTFLVTLATSCGDIVIQLSNENPKTAASFGTLAKTGFYDGLTFHRVVPGFVIQGGDPEGTGTGGPDYSVVEAPPSDTQYTKGVVAMAKTGTEAPGTSGSQFFIVLGDNVGLPAEYAVAGKVISGMDVAAAIGAIPPTNGQDGAPERVVLIEKATLSEK